MHAMATYKVNWPIKGLLKSGAILQPGQIIALDEEAAKRCLQVGSLSVCDSGPKAADPPPEAPASGPAPQPMDLSARSKAQLVDYAHAELGLELDIKKKKGDLLAAIVEAADR